MLSQVECSLEEEQQQNNDVTKEIHSVRLNDSEHQKLPTVLIVTLVRNKAHTLPYFLTYLNRLDYPKNRISLW